jgi:hypothetical protein
VTVVLTILGLAHVVPEFLVAIATIVFGGALLLRGAATISEYARMNVPAAASPAVSSIGDSGVSAVFLAGAAGVVLGILALLGIGTTQLTAIAVIAFGSPLILSCSSALRLHVYRLSLENPDVRARHLASAALADDMLSNSPSVFGLAGLSAIILGILALAEFNPVVLILIALLTLGLLDAVNSLGIEDTVVNEYRRS